MWFTDAVDIPDEVVRARSADKLVVFVGAGASMGAPSSLPSFVQLARDVAGDLSVPDDGAERPDVFLDQLERAGRPMRSNVVQRLSNPASQPSPLHNVIVRMFGNVDTMRIVTTNYDRHLSTAAEHNFGTEPPTYVGPALPLGRKFNGIVYLHGALTGPPEDLVITTTDFGRAYLTDAWAARFLNDLFHHYVTLFVGYSHDDVVMRYLAQGLRPESRRFGFMPDSDDPEKWRPLGVHPISYPAGSDHSSLSDAIRTWGDRIRMGQLDHQQRVQEAVGGDPPQTRADTAYLEWVIADDSTARLFAEHAKGTKWLAWISDRQPFPALFAPGQALSDAAVALAVWFAEFAASEPQAALDVVQRHGAKLHDVTAHRIVRAFRINRPGAKDLGRWLAVLIENATPSLDHELSTLFVHASWPEDGAAALMLFSHLVAHRVEIQPAFPSLVASDEAGDESVGPGVPRFSVESLRGDDYRLREAWASFFEPHLDELVTPLVEILTARLSDAHRVLRGVGQANQEWDEQSFHRSAIAPDDQDSIPWPSHLLVDALRDCVELLTRTRPDDAASLIDRLELSEVPLLRRIALHGWTERTDLSADEKLRHLVVSGGLYAFATKREVYRLIEVAASAAGDARQDLLEAALQGPPEEHALSDESGNDQLALTLLSWIAQNLPNFPAAATAFQQYQDEHPDLLPAEHPGYSSWMGPSGFGGSYPFPVEEVLKCPTAAALDLLIEKSTTEDPHTALTWAFRIPEVIADAASQGAEWARGVLTALAEDGDWKSRYWTAILSGLSRSVGQSGEDQLAALLDLFADVVSRAASASEGGQLLPPIAEFLMAIVHLPEVPGPILDVAEAVAGGIAEKLELGPSDFITEETEGILDRALNNWTGWISRFWVDAVFHRRKLAGNSWTHLSEGTKRSLGHLLDAPFPYSIYPQAILAENYTSINDVDEAWTTSHVRTLFSWATNHDRAARAWSAFLGGAPWNERVGAALNSDLRSAFGEFHGELGKLLAGRFAQLVVFTSSTIHADGTLATFVATADEDVRIEFARSVSWLLLHQVTSEYAESQWPQWIEHYLSERVADRPLPLIPAEASQMLGWIIVTGSHFPKAVALYLQTDARFAEFYGAFNEVDKRTIAKDHSNELAQLLRFVLERSDASYFFVCDVIGKLLHDIIPAVAPTERTTLLAICESAAKLGCPDSLAWKADVEGQWPADG